MICAICQISWGVLPSKLISSYQGNITDHALGLGQGEIPLHSPGLTLFEFFSSAKEVSTQIVFVFLFVF